jgi:iron-sulfur cluster assembly accessory protein
MECRELAKFSLTESAVNKLKKMQLKSGLEKSGLRFADKVGLCGSGYEYVLDLVPHPEPSDDVFYSQGISIYVPHESLKRLTGSVIDYSDQNGKGNECEISGKKGFFVLNPNVKGPCPCNCHKGVDF